MSNFRHLREGVEKRGFKVGKVEVDILITINSTIYEWPRGLQRMREIIKKYPIKWGTRR